MNCVGTGTVRDAFVFEGWLAPDSVSHTPCCQNRSEGTGVRRDGASDAQESRGRLPQSRLHTLAHLAAVRGGVPALSAQASRVPGCDPSFHTALLLPCCRFHGSPINFSESQLLPWRQQLASGTFWGALASCLPQTFRSSSSLASSSLLYLNKSVRLVKFICWMPFALEWLFGV